MTHKVTALGFLGTRIDRGGWRRWRPTVDLCRHDDLVIESLELLVDPKSLDLAKEITRDLSAISPETDVVAHDFDMDDPWDFEEVYGRLHDFALTRKFDPTREDLLIHMTTGTHVAQICLYLLTEARYLPGRLIQTSPPKRGQMPGRYTIIDLDLSRFDRLHARFERGERGRPFLPQGRHCHQEQGFQCAHRSH